MNKFTKEQLQEIAETDHVQCGDAAAMARQLLAGMEREPVYQVLDWHWYDAEKHIYDEAKARGEECRVLYAAPQLPQPAVVPSAVKGELTFIDHFERIICERDGDIDIGQLGRGNYDALMLAALDAFRAAMLQGAEPVSQPYTLPANVIDALEKALQAMSFMGDTLNALDAVCEEDVEYVTPAFEAVREVLEFAEPTQGWIPCSERMPEEIGRYWCYVEEQNCLGKSHYQWNCSWNGDRWWVESENGGRVTHWQPLSAAPHQEAE
nr:MAG TPA: Protein of unknown function (DUF551) [Caudoviricetes sp.]